MKKSYIFFLVLSLPLFAQVPQYNVTMAPGDYQLLFTRDIFSDSLIPAIFESGGMYWNDAQIRFKGHSTRYYPKKSYRVKFSSSNLFEGMRQINFNSMYTDKSFIREKLMWDIFSEMDQLAPEAHHSSLTVNGELKGLYLFIDKVDKYFLQNRGRKVAPMYEANDTYTRADLTIQPDSLLKLYYDKEIGSSSDYSDLTQLIRALNEAPDISFEDTVRKYFYLPSVLNWFTGNMLSMAGDSYVKNYLLYRDTSRTTQQWEVIPWDYDLSFGRSGDYAVPYPGSLLNDGFAYTFPPLSGPSNVLKDRFMATPTLREELRLYTDTVLQTTFTEEHLYPKIDSLSELISEDVGSDPQKWGTVEDFLDHTEALKYFITARRNYLLKTFINTPDGEYNRATLPVSKLDTPYHFVAYDGRQIATLWFTAIEGLDSIRVLVHPESVPPGILNPDSETFVKRWVEITPYPSSARFTAKLQWMYSDVSSLDREVGNGVQDERVLRCYIYDGWISIPLRSRVNPFGNFVTVDSVSSELCGPGRSFALLVPDNYTQTWFRHPGSYWQRWHDIRFADSLIGFIAGEHGTVLRTADGGVSWQESFVGTALPLKSVAIPSVGNILTGGEYGTLYKSVDTGKIWNRIDLGITQNINGVKFKSASEGWIFGEDGLLMQTTDGGVSWFPRATDSVKHIVGLITDDTLRFTVYFRDGSYLSSTDQGATWTTGSVGVTRNLENVIGTGNGHWIVGDSGLVLFSEAAGRYDDISVPTSVTLHDLDVIDGATLYAVGDGGKIFYTINGGTDWYSQYSADSHDLYSVAFTDSTRGFSIGNGGTILTTTTAGTLTGIRGAAAGVPSGFVLHQNFPNPFNSSTVIRYELPERARITLTIYNILGQKVETLVDGDEDAGWKEVHWNAPYIASGVYFYRVMTHKFTEVKKMLLTK